MVGSITIAAALCLIAGAALAGPFDVGPGSYYTQINQVLRNAGDPRLMVDKGECSKVGDRTVCDYPYTNTFSMRTEGPSPKRTDRIELRWSATEFSGWPDVGAYPEATPNSAMGAWFLATSMAFDPELDAG